MQKIAVFDIDKTLYKRTLAFDLASVLLTSGAVSSATEEAIAYLDKQDDTSLVSLLRSIQASGKLDFSKYLDVGRTAGYEAAMDLNLDVEELLAEQVMLGKTIIAISTSPYAVVKPFCDTVGGFDIVVAPRPQNIDGFVGPRSLVKADERNKGEWLKEIVALHNFVFTGSVAVGDSMADAPMLELVERPIAYQPVPELKALAEEKGWEIWDK